VTTWRNWSGLESATPTRAATPADAGDIADEVRRALQASTTVKMVGTGHSFTAISAPEATMLRPEGLTGVVAVDHDELTVTARAGTPLKVLNAELERLGLSLHNMGDIAEQTLAGAISTGTHGTGGTAAGLAAQVVGLELVTGAGDLLRATREENADVLDVARADGHAVPVERGGRRELVFEPRRRACLGYLALIEIEWHRGAAFPVGREEAISRWALAGRA